MTSSRQKSVDCHSEPAPVAGNYLLRGRGVTPGGPGQGDPVTRIGMSLDEYVALRLMPLAGADRAFIEAAEDERERMFPMPKVKASILTVQIPVS